ESNEDREPTRSRSGKRQQQASGGGEHGGGGDPAQQVHSARVHPGAHDLGVVADAHHDEQQERGGDALNDAGVDQRPHGVDAEEVQADGGEREQGNGGIEGL